MNAAQIKKLRTESLLKELIPEALGSLDDARLHELSVVEVTCSRGRSDAKVYLDPTGLDEAQERSFLALLRKARLLIEGYCMNDQGWYRCPKLSFEFDHQLEKNNKIDALFAKAREEFGGNEDKS